MNGHLLGSDDGASLINGLPNDIHDSSQSLRSYRHCDRISSVEHWLATHEAIGSIQSDTAYVGISQMLGHFQHQSMFMVLHFQGIEDGW